ncbi:MAG TPA: FtsW/RodA/SpoVE family cell cycle protein [Acidimicrobiales bacterium]|jgi:cell division protein FtsW (lipid II flippase)|nr:FtsW/RodA/SpoVE family cell cycle protein [Acidimicrobiales bacterium]
MSTLTASPDRPAPTEVRHRRKPRRRTELGLLLLAWLVTVSAYILASLGGTGHIPAHIDVFLGLMIGLTLVPHLANRWLAPDADAVLLPIVVLLNGLGWVMIAELDAIPAVQHSSGTGLAAKQAMWTAVGIALYVATLAVFRHGRDLARYRYLLGLVGIGLLISPLLPGIGESVNGSRLWIRLGPFPFQPVEIAKLALVIFVASYLAEKRELLAHATVRFGNRLIPDPRPFGPILVAWAFALLIIAAEHDIGFALLMFMLFLVMLWMATGRVVYVIVGAALFVAAAFLGMHLFARAGERITIWLHAFKYANGHGYQLVQGEYALGSGGLAGAGLGLGHPGLIPVVVSDMIFAAIGEELGLLGTTSLIVAYLLLVGVGLRIALRHRSDFPKLLAAGLTVILGLQAFIIVAGIIRLLPLTGITLPFVSYGGSSLVANYILVAMLIRLSTEAAAAA